MCGSEFLALYVVEEYLDAGSEMQNVGGSVKGNYR